MKNPCSAIWRFLKRPAAIGAVGVVGIIVGVVGWNVFHYAVEKTTTLEFCISCHTMRDNNFAEYKTTIHYKNPYGVRAECADCHVPKSGWPLYKAKIMAAGDLWGEIVGTIDTREKFEANRLRLAKKVWAEMKANNSQGCRSCHSFEAMDFAHQKPNASKTMQKAWKDGATCIDCHKGIAHHLPDMSSGYKSQFKNLVSAAADNNSADTLYALKTTKVFAEDPSSGDAHPAGSMLPLTEVKVLDRDGDWAHVQVNGWVQEGMERLLVKAMGRRIFEISATPDLAKTFKSTKSLTDKDTGLNWQQGSLTVWVKLSDFSADIKGMYAYGEEIHNTACGACHSAPAPDHFQANQWMGIIKDMKGNTALTTEEVRYLQAYMQLHAKDMPKSEN